MKEKDSFWRKIKSYFREELVEEGDSQFSPRLSVWYMYGKNMLNTRSVNYSYGNLHKVFAETFRRERAFLKEVKDVLLLGLGAGSVPALLRDYGNFRITGVEIDPEVIRLGRKYFGLGEIPGLEIVQGDALEFVQSCKDPYDLAIVDLFIDDEIPKEALTPQWLKQLVSLLRPGGRLYFNRLMHEAHLAKETHDFTQKMQDFLPGTRYFTANTNRMLIYEKPKQPEG